MNIRNRSNWLVLGAIAALTLSSLTAQGEQIGRTVSQARTRLNNFCRTNALNVTQHRGLPHFTVTGSARAFTDGYVNACGTNVVEFFKKPFDGHFHHLYTRIGGHTYSRIWSLSKTSWYPSSGRNAEQRVGVLCQLTNSEMSNLKAFMTENQNSPNDRSNPHGAIGPFNVYGGGANNTHCTNYLENSKGIGANGESLPQVLGKSYTGIAPGWISGLIRSGSPRIVGVAVHNPQGDSTTNLDRFW